MVWATVSSWSCFCWLYRASPSLKACEEYNQSDFGIDNLVMSMYRVISFVVGRGCLLRPVRFSWQISVSICPASFCTPRPNLPITPGISWLPTLHSKPLWWKGHLFLVLVLEGLVCLCRTIQLQLLQHYWLGHRLGSVWYWMVCLGNEKRSFCNFWDCTQVLHFRLFCWLWGLLHSSKDFLSTVVDIMVIWVKFNYSSPF